MNDNLALLKEQHKNCNLLVPGSTDVQLNPFYKATFITVEADLSENSGDVFKVGNVKVGDSWAETFSPAKPLLMKLASAAGIQFDPNNTYGTMLSKNCYKAKAYGAIRLPDGSGKTHCDEKIINLEDEEDRFRLEFMDKSIEGITDPKAAKEASKMFKGEWIEAMDKWDKSCKAYRIADSDRQKYIDRSVMVNMTLLRKTAAEKAMTGAILRVVRALIGMKGQYTKKELEQPFAVCRVTFSPDYSDPEVRRAMLGQGMNSVGNMFGAPASGLLGSAHEETYAAHDDFDPAAFVDNPAFTSDSSPSPDFDESPITPPATPPSTAPSAQKAPDSGAAPSCCADCGEVITPRVAEFSKKNFNRPLCMNCQKGAERA